MSSFLNLMGCASRETMQKRKITSCILNSCCSCFQAHLLSVSENIEMLALMPWQILLHCLCAALLLHALCEIPVSFKSSQPNTA